MLILSGFFEPVFYLLALGQGLGALVGTVDAGAGPVSYAAYIAPGLLATSAMNGAIYDSTVNVFGKLRYAKLYDAMLATSLGSDGCRTRRDRLVVDARRDLLDRVRPHHAGVGAAGVVVGGAGRAGRAAHRVRASLPSGWRSPRSCGPGSSMQWINTAILPMFLFSTTFYPLSVYPPAVAAVVRCLPLYQGDRADARAVPGRRVLGAALARAVFPGDGGCRNPHHLAAAGPVAAALIPATRGRRCVRAVGRGGVGYCQWPDTATCGGGSGHGGCGGLLPAPVGETSGAGVRQLRTDRPDNHQTSRGRRHRRGPRARNVRETLCGRVQYAPGELGEELSQ